MTGPESAWQAAPAGLAIVDGDLIIISANNMLLDLFEADEGELLGESLPGLLGDDESFAGCLRQALGGRQVGPLAATRGVRPLIFSCWQTAGDEDHLAMACYEASALTGSEPADRFRLLAGVIEQSSDAVFIKDLQGRHLLVNPACASLIGRAPAEILGQDVSELFPEEIARKMLEGDRRVMDNGEPEVMEVTVCHQGRGGEPRVFLSEKIPYRDVRGNVVGLLGYGRDVTERRLAEQKLRDSEAKFRGLVEQATDAFFVHRFDGSVVDVNEHACASLGYTREELLSMKVQDFELEWPGDLLAPDKLSQQLPMTLEGRHRRKDGHIFPVEVRLGWFGDGDKRALLALARDVTARKAAEGLLKDAQKELEERVRIRTRDLENANDKLSLEIEERRRVEGQLRQSRRALRRNREQMRELAGKLLETQEAERRRLAGELHDDLTQRLAALSIEAGRIREAKSDLPEPITGVLDAIAGECVNLSVDIHRIARRLHPSILDDLGLVDAIRAECESFQERQDIELRHDLDELPERLPDPIALCLYRVTQEGLNNVAKHARAALVRVSLKCVDSRVILTIVDDGCGFDYKERSHGLGLISMTERARRLSGSIRIETAEGEGTTLLLDLPALPETVSA